MFSAYLWIENKANPGDTKTVPDSVKSFAVVQAWFKAGMISETPNEPVKPAGQEQTDEDSNVERSGDDDEKDALIAKLAEHGIDKTRRSSVRTLREALAEVE